MVLTSRPVILVDLGSRLICIIMQMKVSPHGQDMASYILPPITRCLPSVVIDESIVVAAVDAGSEVHFGH